MAAKIVELTDAVVAVLNAAPFSQAFTATRGYIPTLGKQDEDADSLATLTVVVVPSEQTFVILARGADDWDYIIDVGIFQRVVATDTQMADAMVDGLMALAEEIGDEFRGAQAVAELPARFITAANAPIYDQEMLRQNRLFGTVWRLTFRGSRVKP